MTRKNQNRGQTGMPRITLSLNKEEIQKLKDISAKEQRPFSRQVVYMMECYLENKDKIK